MPPAPPSATALLIVRLEIATVPLCTKKARPALAASRVLLLPVTVTLVVIMGSDWLSVMNVPGAMVMVLLPPAVLELKIAWRRSRHRCHCRW